MLPGLGRRPALIVSADEINLGLRQPVVARVTSTARPRAVRTYVPLAAGEAGLEAESFVLCHDLTTLPTEAVGLRLGRLSRRRMLEVDAALRRGLALE
jgi:mRNA-degrading endonuclease toxin of MazEF toxin-antitoxin module